MRSLLQITRDVRKDVDVSRRAKVRMFMDLKFCPPEFQGAFLQSIHLIYLMGKTDGMTHVMKGFGK
jgi:hypothetical protein